MSDRPAYRLHIAVWLVILASVALFVLSQAVPQRVDFGDPSLVVRAYGWPNVGYVTFTGPPNPWGWRGLRFEFDFMGLPRPFQAWPQSFIFNVVCFVPFALGCAFLLDWWLRRRLSLIHVFWIMASSGVVFATWIPDFAEQPSAGARFWTLFGIVVIAARICFVFWAGWITGRALRAAWRLYVEANVRAITAVVDAAAWCLRVNRHRACAATASRSNMPAPPQSIKHDAHPRVEP